MRPAFLALLAPGALALLTLAAPAQAADPPAPAGLPAELGASCARAPAAADIQAASVAARVAAQFFERGDWDKAIRYWTQAYASDCTAFSVLINLADAYEKKGDKVSSTAVLELYLKRSTPPSGKPGPAPSTPPPVPSAPPPAPSTPPPAPSAPVVPAPSAPPPAPTTPPPAPPASSAPSTPPPPATPVPEPPPPAREPPPAPIEPVPTPPPPARAPDEARSLKGHAFLYPALIEAPFVTSSIRLATEIGAFAQRGVSATSSIDTPFVSSPVIYDRDPRFVQQHFGVGVAVSQYLGFDFDGTYAALVGGNEQSAFLYGSSSGDDLRVGTRIKILRLAGLGTQIGARVYGLLQNTTRLRPASLLEEIAKENKTGTDAARNECLAASDFSCAFAKGFSASDAIRISRAQYGGGLSVSAAQPLGTRFGIIASLGADFSAAKLTSLAGNVSSTPISVYAGLAPSVDLAPTLPLGAMLEYRILHQNESFSGSNNAPGGSAKSDQHSVAAGVYYTGRPELQLGFIFAGTFTTTSNSEPLTSVLSGRLSARYFF